MGLEISEGYEVCAGLRGCSVQPKTLLEALEALALQKELLWPQL